MDEPTSPATGNEFETVTSADGTEIAFERTGSGPPLVLVYGNGDVHEFWEEGGVRPALADTHTVYAIERRGRGESGDVREGDALASQPESPSDSGDVTDRSPAGQPGASGSDDVRQTSSAEPRRTEGSGDAAGYDLEREAEDVAAVVDSIEGPATLLGHSGGALYALEAALLTDDLRTLILYEPPIQVGDNRLDVAGEITEMEALVEGGENEQALVLFVRDVAGLPPEEIDALRSAPIWEDMVDAAHTLPRELQAISEYEFEGNRFTGVTTPTLLLSGSESPPLYREATRAVDDALPNSRIATFEGEQHMAMHTAPDRFVGEVRTFIREAN